MRTRKLQNNKWFFITKKPLYYPYSKFSTYTRLSSGKGKERAKDVSDNTMENASESPSNSSMSSKSFYDENVQELKEQYKGRTSEFIHRQENIMDSMTKKSNTYIANLMDERNEERSLLTDKKKLEEYDKDTKSLIEDETILLKSELASVKYIRDTTLDLMDGEKAYSECSGYDSDYISETSENLYNDIDTKDTAIKSSYDNDIKSHLAKLDSLKEASPVAGPSNQGKKRTRDDEEFSENKRHKQDSSDVHQEDFPSWEPFDE